MNCLRKKVLILLAFVFAFSGILGVYSPTADAAKKKIGITKFDADFTVRLPHGGNYDIGTGATDMLTNELVKNKNYEVMERQQLAQVTQEQRLGATGAIDDSTAAQMGKLIGLNYIVYGKILSAGAEVKRDGLDLGKFATEKQVLEAKVLINVRMIDANTGAIVVSKQAQGSVKKKSSGFAAQIGKQDVGKSSSVSVTAEIYDQAVLDAIKEIASQINAINPLEASVASVSGGDIYLDIGMEQGVEAGTKFQIYREGKAITNAAGDIIGMQKQNIATVVVKSVEGNMSICEVQRSKKDKKKDKDMPLIQQGDKARLI